MSLWYFSHLEAIRVAGSEGKGVSFYGFSQHSPFPQDGSAAPKRSVCVGIVLRGDPREGPCPAGATAALVGKQTVQQEHLPTTMQGCRGPAGPPITCRGAGSPLGQCSPGTHSCWSSARPLNKEEGSWSSLLDDRSLREGELCLRSG